MRYGAPEVCYELLFMAQDYGEPYWITGFGSSAVWIGDYNYFGMDPGVTDQEDGHILGMAIHEMAHKAGMSETLATHYGATCTNSGPTPNY